MRGIMTVIVVGLGILLLVVAGLIALRLYQMNPQASATAANTTLTLPTTAEIRDIVASEDRVIVYTTSPEGKALYFLDGTTGRHRATVDIKN